MDRTDMSQDPLASKGQRLKSLKTSDETKLEEYIRKNPNTPPLDASRNLARRYGGAQPDTKRGKLPTSTVKKLAMGAADLYQYGKAPDDPYRIVGPELAASTSSWITKSILRSLLIDVERLRPGTKGLERDLVTLEARVEHEGVSFVATALVALGKAFLKGLEEGRFTAPVGFKRPKGSKIPCLFKGIFGEVFDPVTGDLVKERDSTEDVKILCQLLFFLEEVHTTYGLAAEAACQGDLFFHEL